jgi:hypothetical protein
MSVADKDKSVGPDDYNVTQADKGEQETPNRSPFPAVDTKESAKLEEAFVTSTDQNEALLKYKATGQVGDYIDPTRDQEIDIAPHFGDAPHPELHNPEPAGVPPLGAKVPGQFASVAAFDLATQEPLGVPVDVAQLPPEKDSKDDQNDSPKSKPSTAKN